ncbi:MAG TPA: hypothetical protein VML75_24605 [Kofleriaceae bacterium]|nr:hypothetical protein [Kofleriaceae bacterium]
MTKKLTGTLVGIAAIAALLAAPSLADAQKRIVVLEVEGARNGALRASLAQIVGDENRVIDGAKYTRLAKRMKAGKLTPENVALVAAKLEADGVIESMIVADRDQYMLRLRVREGATGRTVKKLAIKLKKPALSRGMQEQLSERLLDAVDGLRFNDAELDFEPESGAVEDAEDDDEDGDDTRARRAKPASKAAVRKASKTRERKVASADDDEIVADDDEGDDDDDEELDDAEAPPSRAGGVRREATVPMPAAVHRRRGAMSLSAGLAVMTRELAFTTRPDMINAPEGYTGPAAPAVRVAGELYPLAIDSSRTGLAANVGIGFELDHVIGLQTQVDSGGMPVNLPTTEMRYSAGLRVRHAFGSKPTHPSIKLSVNYSKLEFAVQKQEGVAIDLPNTTYTYFDPGLELRVPFTARVAMLAGARAMLMRDAGEVQQSDQYGTAKITGYDASGGFELAWSSRLVFQLAARYMAIGYEFQGDGEMSNNRDGDPMSIDVGGALDRYMSGSLTAGYLF